MSTYWLGLCSGVQNATSGTSLLDILVAASAAISALIAIIALFESRRALRVASIEAYPVALEGGVFLGVHLRNFGPRYAKDVRWEVWVETPDHDVIYRQMLRMPILATGDAREVVIGFDPKRAEKRTLQALADSGGTLTSDWSWRDGRRIVFFQRQHREHLEVALVAVLDDFANALQRQPDETLDALREIRRAIEGIAQAPSEPKPGRSLRSSIWAFFLDTIGREGR